MAVIFTHDFKVLIAQTPFVTVSSPYGVVGVATLQYTGICSLISD